MVLENNLFAHEEIRPYQDALIHAVEDAMQNSGQLVVHAPTGLGKTAASLAPAIKYALDHDKTVMFLTSRHTQHQIALDTVQKMIDRHNVKIPVADLVGKSHYCLQPGAGRLKSKEFLEYCKALREDKACEFYENVKVKEELSTKSKLALKDLNDQAHSSTEIKETSKYHCVCPYEIAILLAKEAKVIVTDYNYLFNPGVANRFLQKIGKELKDIIVVVDEAHNLPNRVKESASDKLSTFMLKRAAAEAEKFEHTDLKEKMEALTELFRRFGLTIQEEMNEQYMEKEDLTKRLKEFGDVDSFIETLEKVSEAIREEQQYSYLGAVGEFLRMWCEGEDEGYTRILEENEFQGDTMITLHYKCLDPSVITATPLNNAHAAIIMSGTLSPTRMYKELFGVLKAKEMTLQSPFPEKNRLTLIIPRTSTKFTLRNEQMYKDIAMHCAKVVNNIPGNCAIFFPSYALLTNIEKFFASATDKTVFTERKGMTKEDKHDFLERFKQYKDQGAVLLGVISGSFGEGVDLPGDLLKGVIVVGLPLNRPDLETKALIQYFDNKYGRGWDYGYTFPAFNKTLQSAGRCIRTQDDRGVMVFLDERYNNPQYKECFPANWDIKTTLLYEKLIQEFFVNDTQSLQEKKKEDLTNW